MNTKTLSQIHRFGKVGKIVMTLLLVAAIIATLLCGAAAIYVATLPEDAVKVSVTNHAQFKINESCFSSVWNFLAKSAAYSSDQSPADALKDDADSHLLPEENTKLDVQLDFFRQSYSSATVRSENGGKIIDAESSPSEYCSRDFIVLLVFAALLCASLAAALLLLQRLFKVLSVCESPFCADFVSKLRAFGYSLLPVALISSVGETLAVRFLTAGKGACVSVQWGVLVAFAVAMFLVTVFRYGAKLQKESDETL